jgi:predicted oxidoreductase
LYDETFDGLQDQRVAPMIWSPLGGGRVFRDDPASAPLRTALAKVAAETGKPLTTVVFAWIMQLPCAPLPITGSGRIEAIAEAAAATQLKLTRTQWFEILRAATGHDVP